MQSSTREVLAEIRSALAHVVPWATDVLTLFEKAQWNVNRIEPADRANQFAPWQLYLTPPNYIRELFGFRPEVLALIAPGQKVQARDIQFAEQSIPRDLRLDRSIVWLFARDEDARIAVPPMVEGVGREYIISTRCDLSEISDVERWVRARLEQHFERGRIFEWGRPVREWQFFGRRDVVGKLERLLAKGNPIGLYGLRKIGKTSLLHALADRLIADRRALPVHVDMLKLSFAEKDKRGFARHLLLGLRESIGRWVEAHPEMQPIAVHVDERGGSSEAAAQHALEEALDHFDRVSGKRVKVYVFIDEYERLFGAHGFPAADGLDILDWFRSLNQQRRSGFNFVLTGLSRRLTRIPRFDGRQNPLLDLVTEMPLAGLSETEIYEMLNRLGRRIRIDFQPDIVSAIWAVTGGHPYLTRLYADRIDRASKVRPYVVTSGEVTRRRCEFDEEAENTLREIHDHLVEEAGVHVIEALRWLANEPEDRRAVLEVLELESVKLLNELGVTGDTEDGFRLGAFAEWLRRNSAPRHAAVGT